MDQHGLPSPQVPLQHQGIVRRAERLRHRRTLHELKAPRHRHHVARLRNEQLRVSATAHETHDPGSDRGFVSALAHGLDHAGKLETGDVGGCAGRRRIRATSLEEIGPVQSGSVYLDTHLPRPRQRLLEIREFQDVRLPRTCDANRFHSVIPPGQCLPEDDVMGPSAATGRTAAHGGRFRPGPGDGPGTG